MAFLYDMNDFTGIRRVFLFFVRRKMYVTCSKRNLGFIENVKVTFHVSDNSQELLTLHTL